MPEARDKNLLTVGNRKTEFGTFTVLADSERLEAYLEASALKQGLVVEALVQLLADMGITHGVRKDTLALAAKALDDHLARSGDRDAIGALASR